MRVCYLHQQLSWKILIILTIILRVQRRSMSSPYMRNCNRRSASNYTCNSSTTTASKVATTAMKEVILLKKPCDREVPKYGKKSEMYRTGYIMDAVEIDRNWSEQEMRTRLATIFADKRKSISGYYLKGKIWGWIWHEYLGGVALKINKGGL